MKKILLSLVAVVMAFVAYAEDPVVTMTPTTSNMTKTNSYTASFTLTQAEGTWTIYGFNNNNCGWATNPIRCGRKNNTASTAKISTDFMMTASISRIEIDVTRIKTGGSISSLILKVSEDNSFATTTNYTVDVTSQPTAANKQATFTVDITEPSENKFYQLYLDLAGGSANGYLAVNEIRYYGTVAAGTVAFPVITPAGGTYTTGEEVEVSIDCATEGASLSYTIDGGEAIEYTAPFHVTESCTIVATATNGTDTKTSEEAVFTFVEPVKFGYVTSVTSGKKYLLVAENETVSSSKTMVPLTGTYGYINVIDVAPEDGYIRMTSDVNAITITETEGGYTLQDSNGKYLYQTGTYNSFNVSADMPEDGAVWTIEFNNDGRGSMTITNTSVNKYIQYSTSYNSFGSYASLQSGALLPRLYEEGATAVEDPLTGVEEIATENAPIEYYNLQGVKVARPENGIFIKKQGSRTSKVVL